MKKTFGEWLLAYKGDNPKIQLLSDDYFCKKLKIKPKWVVPSYESELVNGLFSKNGKVRFFSYNKLIDEFGYTKETIAELMEELKQ